MEPMDIHPQDDLIRMVDRSASALEVRAKDAAGNGTLVGYPITFNEWTEISGWEGNFLERVSDGAATKTVDERRNQIKVLFNHGMDPTIGDKPLGKPSVMKPDKRGLWTETPLSDTSYNKDIRVLLEDEVIDGMSFRFSVKREEWADDPGISAHNPKGLPERTIHEFKLFEFGPVTFPAYEATTAGVRARPAFDAWRQAHQTSDTPKIPVSASAAPEPEGTPAEANDTPPIEAPVGNEKRELLLREAARMDRLTAAAIRVTL